MTPEDFTAYLHEHIPLTAACALRVTVIAPGEIRLLAPLQANRNHRGTAFGGSLSTAAIVSGWAVLNLALREAQLPSRLVIQKSECEYLESVDADFAVESRLPDADEWARFLKTLKKRGKARIVVNSRISIGGRPLVTAVNHYVALHEKQT